MGLFRQLKPGHHLPFAVLYPGQIVCDQIIRKVLEQNVFICSYRTLAIKQDSHLIVILVIHLSRVKVNRLVPSFNSHVVVIVVVYQHPVSLFLLKLSFESVGDHTPHLWMESLHHQVS